MTAEEVPAEARVRLITGATSGFGHAIATAALAAGDTVVQMSSIGGQVVGPGFGAYCATRFALEGLTETLRQEVDFGVDSLLVEPGAFRTGLFDPAAAHVSEPMPEYAATVGPTRDYVRAGMAEGAGDPAKAARAILTALAAPALSPSSP